jgi:hypothetical protein
MRGLVIVNAEILDFPEISNIKDETGPGHTGGEYKHASTHGTFLNLQATPSDRDPPSYPIEQTDRSYAVVRYLYTRWSRLALPRKCYLLHIPAQAAVFLYTCQLTA